MNTVSADCLIHFTKKYTALKSIITNGLRYSYALEHFQSYAPFPKEYLENDEYNIEGTAIPMICFCDIPLNLAQKHSNEYGHFFIAFDKQSLSLLLGNKLNPVYYINSDASYDVLEMLKQRQCDQDISKVYDYMLAMSKPIKGTDLSGRIKDFYNEREWRTFYYSDDNQFCQWERNVRLKDGEEFRQFIQRKNKILYESNYAYLNLKSEDLVNYIVTYIGIKDDSYRERIIKFIKDSKTIFGFRNISEATKLNLISKIISFERIKSDF